MVAGKLLAQITMEPPAHTSDIAQQWEYMQGFKEAFLGKEVLAVLVSFFSEPLSVGSEYVI